MIGANKLSDNVLLSGSSLPLNVLHADTGAHRFRDNCNDGNLMPAMQHTACKDGRQSMRAMVILKCAHTYQSHKSGSAGLDIRKCISYEMQNGHKKGRKDPEGPKQVSPGSDGCSARACGWCDWCASCCREWLISRRHLMPAMHNDVMYPLVSTTAH